MADSPPNQKRSFGWILWIPIVLLAPYFFLMLLNSDSFPPRWYERRTQRQKVVERVQFAGGWAALQKDCDGLAGQYRDSSFYWHRWATNALPPTLAALKPWEIRFDSPSVLREFKEEPQVAVVRIKVFGMHSTGGHSTPYFGLEVVSGPGAESYRPRPSRGGVSGNGYRSFSPVTDRIYEIY
jgi:hypothetical protein